VSRCLQISLDLFRGDEATSMSVNLLRHNDACVRRW